PARAAPGLDLLHRGIDVIGVGHDERLQALRVTAAEIVEVSVVGAQELDVDLGNVGATRHAGYHEGDVDTLFVHVLDARGGVPVLTTVCRVLRPLILRVPAALTGARQRLTEIAWDIRAPATTATTPEAVGVPALARAGVPLGAPRHPVLGQIWDQLTHARREEPVECLGRSANVRIDVVGPYAVSHVLLLPRDARCRLRLPMIDVLYGAQQAPAGHD